MNTSERERLIEYILSFMPLLHKKLLMDVHHKKHMYKMSFLKMLNHHSGEPMKFFGERLLISKPNLTKLCNKLIDEELIERKNSDEDRRIIRLYITDKGKAFVNAHRQEMRKEMLKKLEALNDEDVQILNQNFNEVESIISKL